MHTVRCGFDGIPTVRFGAVFKNRKCYTVRFGVFTYPTVLFGAIFRNQESYDPVRFGFEEVTNPTVRFGAVNRTKPQRTGRKTTH